MPLLGDLFSRLLSAITRKEDTLSSAKQATPDDSSTDNEYSDASIRGILREARSAVTPPANVYDLISPPSLHVNTVKRLRSKIHDIPPMPEIWHQIQQILEDPEASAAELGACIAKDPVLSAKVLMVCNSSAYRTSDSSEVTNMPLAIARLGLDATSNIIFQTLAPKLERGEENQFQVRHVWMHSQVISSLTRILVAPCHRLSLNDASLIGMLHDIGKLAILYIESDKKLAVLKCAIETEGDTLWAEHKTLGYTHIDAGITLALHWRLPKQVRHYISYHHHASSLPASSIPRELRHGMVAVNLAHIVLQHFLADTEEKISRRIWGSKSCIFAAINDSFIASELLLPLNSEATYRLMEREMGRIRHVMPELFSS
ncbi:HDOD domain-containing protein [Mariprofundus aestuarium]|uniref:HDOD domain-containing protein n=1 Tax=Mariprofundus aestuarium TaxID=1921086 RepID=A0A2K8KXR7_MARES|nr:HDOD domain-containing protein [Mariprofundus aestuarium]ATX78649.1 HDOD domain-containing protein [Mariprofundus aestuarium]